MQVDTRLCRDARRARFQIVHGEEEEREREGGATAMATDHENGMRQQTSKQNHFTIRQPAHAAKWSRKQNFQSKH